MISVFFVCVWVSFVMFSCVYVWVCFYVSFVMFGFLHFQFFNVWFCVCRFCNVILCVGVGFLLCGCVYVWTC